MNERVAILLDSVRLSAAAAGDVAADAAYGVGKKAGALLSVAKLNIRLMECKGGIKDALMEAGELVYATHTGGNIDSEVLMEKLRQLDALYAEAADLERQIGKEQETHTCSVCGAFLQDTHRFCGECGQQVQ